MNGSLPPLLNKITSLAISQKSLVSEFGFLGCSKQFSYQAEKANAIVLAVFSTVLPVER